MNNLPKSYLERCTNEQLLKRIENLPFNGLEELIDIYANQLKKLKSSGTQEKNVSSKFKKKPPAKELPFLLEKMRKSVDKFLNLEKEEIPFCNIAYFGADTISVGGPSGLYHYSRQLIEVERCSKKNLCWLLAHEYAHHVQFSIMNPPFLSQNSSALPELELSTNLQYSIFLEGHADGVARHVSQRHTRRHSFSAFAIPPVKRMYLTLQYAKKEKLSTKEITDHHDLGNLLFAYLEHREGPGIYKAMVHGEYDW
ncbi:hypothetical protein HYX13_00575 [Candidatus Woesearchaeota archaeon]|nr:hypothetical protein [Candidatus Woesearchaeota archaeon]